MRKKEIVANGEGLKSMSLLKKTAITTILGVGLTLNVASADIGLDTIYHVYLDGEHVGTVDNKDIITSYIDDRIVEKENANDSYSYAVKQEISYIPERVFNPNSNNEKVLDIVQDDISIQVNAYELQIGGDSAGYFKDEETARQALYEYKAKYVDKKILDQFKQQEQKNEKESSDKEKEQSGEQEQTLAVGDSTTLDVTLSEKVSFEREIVKEKEVLTVDKGVELLEKGTLEDKLHEVEEGDVLGTIAQQYDLDTDQLLELNPDLSEDSILQIGQKINVTAYAPFVDVIVKKEKMVEEKISYKKEVQESDRLYKGDSKIKQEGQEGKKEVHYALEIINGKVNKKKVVSEEVTKDPVKEIVVKGTKVIPSRGTGNFTWPTVGGYVSSHMGPRWGSYHKGMDIAGPSNRAILAADNGTVVSAGWDNGGYGNKIVINHNNGYKTIYAHLSSISVRPGQTVVKGSKIGVMGTTGNSTGVHLHIEVYKNGARINPASIF
ncbi:Murein DD-endopeptidase MepM [Paraliobacillus sp. PM-2]|uniref:M23 family metallopeptidase n=1 Tax=Paraliobacillus sp. PM-2 TaxID=1462524 RepID=UPI00061C16DA|nr:M23 family metallopeptidase [Paraliobacillus sp. PM-2]CQR45836.1 Murein DD-endopeptidase MepM [Paraliobacillus sp. PM-2]